MIPSLLAAALAVASPGGTPPPGLSFTMADLAPITRTDAPRVLYVLKTMRLDPNEKQMAGAVAVIHDRLAHMGEVQFLSFDCAHHTFRVEIEGKVANAGEHGELAVVERRLATGRDFEFTPTADTPNATDIEAWACTGKLPEPTS